MLLILAFGIPIHALPDHWGKEQVYYQEKAPETWYEKAYNATFGSRFFQQKLKEPLSLALGGTMRLFAGSLDGTQ